jgi:hypothetical protein
MPNWCSNEITITGDVSEIVKALDSIENKEERNVFKTLIGLPDGIGQEEYEKDWYNINLDRFGTKWDISYEDCDPQEFDDELVLTPNTAWSPPTEFCVNLAKKYGVEIEMYYYESGNDFCGKTYINSDGTYREEDYRYVEGLYHFESDYFWLEIRDYVEYAIEEGQPIDEFLEEHTYLNEEDKEEVIKIFKQNEIYTDK